MEEKHYSSLDGLRGVAVIVVIGFHLGLAGWEGGYLGVDAFFVISGFIVTKVTLKRLRPTPNPNYIPDSLNESIEPLDASGLGARRDFDWSEFFLRRVKRLWPELYLVMTFTLIAGAAILRTGEFRRLPVTSMSQVLMGSNIRFWVESESYFAEGAREKPLLHCWSLAVEEQFYVFFAALLRLRGSKQCFSPFEQLFILLIFAGSLGWTQHLSTKYPSAVFYLLPFRTWQFFCGIIPAFRLERDALKRASYLLSSSVEIFRELPPFLLIGTLFLGFAYDSRISAVSPILAQLVTALSVTGLVTIFVSNEDAGYKSIGSKVLSFRPVVLIGEISYSLYLWHWPLICFAHKIYGDTLTPVQIAGISVSMFCLAFFSHFFITKPIRAIPNSSIRNGKGYFLAAIVTITSFSLLCLNGYILSADTDDFAFSWVKETQNLSSSATSRTMNSRKNFNPGISPFAQHHFSLDKGSRKNQLKIWHCPIRKTGWRKYCCIASFGNCSNPNGRHVLVEGDSHATMIGGVFYELAEELGFCLHLFAEQSCPPFLKGYLDPSQELKEETICYQMRYWAFNLTAALPHKLDLIFLASRWELYMGRLVLDRKKIMYYGDQVRNDLYTQVTQVDKDRFKAGLQSTIEAYRAYTKKIVVMSETPMFMRGRWKKYCQPKRCLLSSDSTNRTIPFMSRQLLNEVVQNFSPQTSIFDPTQIFCNDTACNPYLDGILAYQDVTHLNQYGAQHLRNAFKSLL